MVLAGKLLRLVPTLFIVLGILRSALPGAATLHFVASLPLDGPAKRIYILPDKTGWFVGVHGIWRTADAGRSWVNSLAVGTPSSLSSQVVDADFQGDHGFVLSSEQLSRAFGSVATWEKLPATPFSKSRGVAEGLHLSPDGRRIWIYGGIYRNLTKDEDAPNFAVTARDGKRLVLEAAVFISLDGGENWSPQPLPNPGEAEARYVTRGMSVDRSGHAVTFGESWICFSNDLGTHWNAGYIFDSEGKNEEDFSEGRYQLRHVQLLGDGVGLLSADNGAIYRTIDAGKTWHQSLPVGSIRSRSSARSSWFTSMVFSSDLHGFGTDISGLLFETRDRGMTWHSVAIQPQIELDTLGQTGASVWTCSKGALYSIEEGGVPVPPKRFRE